MMPPFTTEPAVPGSARPNDVAAAARAELRRWLLRHRNADGGWGYRPGRPSRLEPTCWALLATRPPSAAADVQVLDRWPTRGGVPLEGPSGALNYAFAGLAAVVWLRNTSNGSSRELRAALLALENLEGIRLPQSNDVRQNNQLRGWPWTPEAFSWVEPTAWCLLALKQWRANGESGSGPSSRIAVGDRLLLDRAIETGGWNYGNSMVYGKVLQPFVPTTALALLALRDQRDAPEVVRGIGWLRQHRLSEPSAFALAWAVIGLRAYGHDVSDLQSRTMLAVDDVARRGDILSSAVLAESLGDPHEDDPFAI